MRCPALKLLMALALGAVACGGESPEPGKQPGSTTASSGTDGQSSSATAVSEAARKEAASIFTTRCTPCHGAVGKGDGPASAGLTPKPRDLSDPAWQQAVDDEYLEKILLYGGIAVGKSAAMPPNPDLNGKAEILKALRLHVRALQGS